MLEVPKVETSSVQAGGWPLPGSSAQSAALMKVTSLYDIEDACGESPPPPHPPCTPSLHTQFEKEKEKEKQKDKEKEKEKGKEKEKEKEREKEKEKEKQRLNSLKYSFIMFEVSVENRFEINEN